MELWERAAQAQLLRIARINAGHEGAHKSFEKFSGEFSAHERGDRFILFRWPARAKQVAQDAPFRTRAEEGRSEESWRRERYLTQRSVNEHVARRMPWCLDQLALNAQVAAQFEQRRCSVETLWAQFEEKTIAPLGPNNAARAGRGFYELGIYAGFAQGVSAYQARYSAAHNQSWRVSRHGIWQFLSASECFRKQRFGVEMLFFQIGIKNHR